MSSSPKNSMAVSMAVAAEHALCLSLTGDIDRDSEIELLGLTGTLAATPCSSVYIDLHEITFADASLISFLVRLAADLPSHATLTLCRPQVATVRLIESSGLENVATVRPDLPPQWIAPWARPAAPVATPRNANAAEQPAFRSTAEAGSRHT